jgi:hypothetical protein
MLAPQIGRPYASKSVCSSISARVFLMLQVLTFSGAHEVFQLELIVLFICRENIQSRILVSVIFFGNLGNIA